MRFCRTLTSGMKIIQKLSLLTVSLFAVAAFALSTVPVQAADDCKPTKTTQCCGNTSTAIIGCAQDNKGKDIKDNGVWGFLIIALNIITAGVGVLAVGGIVYGAILYTTAEDKADQVKKAQDMIQNVVIGLIAFALM